MALQSDSREGYQLPAKSGLRVPMRATLPSVRVPFRGSVCSSRVLKNLREQIRSKILSPGKNLRLCVATRILSCYYI